MPKTSTNHPSRTRAQDINGQMLIGAKMQHTNPDYAAVANSPLFKVPLEVRRQIYYLWIKNHGWNLYELMRTCKVIAREAEDVLCRVQALALRPQMPWAFSPRFESEIIPRIQNLIIYTTAAQRGMRPSEAGHLQTSTRGRPWFITPLDDTDHKLALFRCCGTQRNICDIYTKNDPDDGLHLPRNTIWGIKLLKDFHTVIFHGLEWQKAKGDDRGTIRNLRIILEEAFGPPMPVQHACFSASGCLEFHPTRHCSLEQRQEGKYARPNEA